MLGVIEMNKWNKFNKYFYTIIFSIISLSVFIMKLEAYNPVFLTSTDPLVNFFTEFEYAFKSYDILYVAIWILLLYFYFHIYLDGNKYTKKSLLCTIIAIIFSVITIVSKSFKIDDSLNLLNSSVMQMFKTGIFFFGYYFIYYAIIKKILSIKFNFEKLKKKQFFSLKK